MQEFLYEYYRWILAGHVISMVAWMAGMLYLPRLFVYHADAVIGSDKSETFKVMEYKLLKFIINPAMGSTWILGLTMLYANPELLSQGWLHVKLTCVLILSALHGLFSRHRKAFLADKNVHSAKYYRILNEIPTFLLMIIIVMVIVRPF
ncbi:MAG TPA: protoporphyrinogen oxidase HemJ [Alphaproteobacteria bacterium]